MGVKRIAAAIVVVGLLAVPVSAQYGWFTLDGGLIARLSSSTTAVTIRQDGSGAVLDLYAGSTRIFRAAANGLHTVTGSILSTTAYIIGSADTSGVRLDLESGSLAVREGDDSGYAPIIASMVTVGDEVLSDRGSGELGVGGNFAAGSASGIRVVIGSIGVGYPGGLYRGTGGTAWGRIGVPALNTVRLSNADDTDYIEVVPAAWGTTLSAEGVSVADAAVLSGPASGVGTLTVSIGTDNDVCVFALTGTDAPVELTDSGTLCTITKDNASTVNVYYDTDGYKVQNNRGGARTLRILFIGG